MCEIALEGMWRKAARAGRAGVGAAPVARVWARFWAADRIALRCIPFSRTNVRTQWKQTCD